MTYRSVAAAAASATRLLKLVGMPSLTGRLSRTVSRSRFCHKTLLQKRHNASDCHQPHHAVPANFKWPMTTQRLLIQSNLPEVTTPGYWIANISQRSSIYAKRNWLIMNIFMARVLPPLAQIKNSLIYNKLHFQHLVTLCLGRGHCANRNKD